MCKKQSNKYKKNLKHFSENYQIFKSNFKKINKNKKKPQTIPFQSKKIVQCVTSVVIYSSIVMHELSSPFPLLFIELQLHVGVTREGQRNKLWRQPIPASDESCPNV